MGKDHASHEERIGYLEKAIGDSLDRHEQQIQESFEELVVLRNMLYAQTDYIGRYAKLRLPEKVNVLFARIAPLTKKVNVLEEESGRYQNMLNDLKINQDQHDARDVAQMEDGHPNRPHASSENRIDDL